MGGQYRGALYGALIGDCFGALFRESGILSNSSRLVLRNFLDSFEQASSRNGMLLGKSTWKCFICYLHQITSIAIKSTNFVDLFIILALKKPYTDVTALTLAAGDTLASSKQNASPNSGSPMLPCDHAALATSFVEEFCKNMNRGFDSRLIEVFYHLKKNGFIDVLAAAREIPDAGDNSCAAYITPIALYCNKHQLPIEDVVRDIVKVTHTHENSVNGAILHTNAIVANLQATERINIDEYMEKLFKAMSKSDAYRRQLENIQKLLKIGDPSEEHVVNLLGHSSDAVYSVPTALYCFLQTIKDAEGKENQKLRDGIEYAMTIGGHTNAITSMTGSLCGALYGESNVNPKMLEHCDGFERIKTLSDHFV